MELRSFFKKSAYSLIRYSGLLELGKILQRKNIQIVTYHGLCLPGDTSLSWLPQNFNTTEQFAEHMNYFSKRMTPLSLEEAVYIVQSKKPCVRNGVVISFDDGYSNNIAYGEPIINRYKIPVTIFLSTDYMDSGELFPHDRYKCLKYWMEKGYVTDVRDRNNIANLKSYKDISIVDFLQSIENLWTRLSCYLDSDQRRLLKPLEWNTIQQSSSLVQWGAHTCTHSILSHLLEKRRREEIGNSLKRVRDNCNTNSVSFCYPNGEPEDFGEFDMNVLTQNKALCAVTTSNGSFKVGDNLFCIKRRSLSLGFDYNAFLSELYGVRGLINRFF